MKYRLVIGAALAFTALGSASAQTLEETFSAAYASNPTLAAERARLEQTEEGFFQARAARLPTLGANASVTEQQNWGGAGQFQLDPEGSASYGVTLSQAIYRGGRISGSIDGALARILAGREQLRSVEQGVFIAAVSAHADVVRDLSVVSIRSNNVEVLAEQLRAARDRFEVGEITRTDVAQAEARLSGARAQFSAAQAALAASRAAYQRVTGIEPVQPADPEAAPATPDDYAQAVDVAISNNPDLLAAQYAERAAEQGVRVARGALLPEVSLSASAGESRTSDFTGQARGSASVRAQVSVPIFTGGLNRSRVREARAGADVARLQGLAVRRQVVEGVSNAWNNYLAALAVITSSREAVRANEIAFEGVEQEAFVGLRTTLDVLNAEQELLNSRLELVRAERDLTVASYALMQAMGLLHTGRLALPVETYDPEAEFDAARGLNFDLTPWD